MVGQDLFRFNNADYLITADYYSDFWELDKLDSATSESVVNCTKAHFLRLGIADRVITDNGP